MLGRRQYRIKVLQSLYAYFQGGEPNSGVAEKNLLQSIDKVYELFWYQVSFLLEVLHFYQYRTEESKTKFLPTPEELDPNLKLLKNRLVVALQNNLNVAGMITKYRISWTEEQDMVRRVYQKIRTSKDHQDYLNSGQDSFSEDRGFLDRLFRKFIARSPDFQNFCEERNIFWYDDFDVAALYVLKAIKLMPEQFGPEDSLLDLFVKEAEDDPQEDRVFIAELFRKSILHSDELAGLIDKRTRNWELERIALTDILLIKMALVEFMYFPQIPVKVTMNEYIEISKQFSSQKSKLFINGILDKLVEDLTAENKIRKTGRGLIT